MNEEKRPEKKPYRPRRNTDNGRNRPNSVSNTPKQTKVGDARRTALAALCDVTMHGAYSNLALDKRLREGELSPENARLASMIFYTALEKRVQIAWYLSALVKSMPQDVCQEILHIACAQILYMNGIPDHAAVDEAVRQVKRLRLEQYTAFVNGTLRSLIRARDAGELTLPDKELSPYRWASAAWSASENLVKRLADTFGWEEAEAILTYAPQKRQETVRYNSLRMTEPEMDRLIEKRGWVCEQGILPGVRLLTRPGSLTADPAYREGLFSVQSQSSMLSALAMEVKPGMNVLDACSAPGGKTCLMAEQMRDTGRVYAMDPHAHRVDLVRAAARRLRLNNVRPMEADAAEYRPNMDSSMDAVLVDAPCTGLGVLHEKPDMRISFDDAKVAELSALQKRILDTCARYVKPGGALVYSTCTLLPEENQNQVRKFLVSHPDFELKPLGSILPEPLREAEKDGMTQFFAHRHPGMEGFFIARLKRKGTR